MPVDVIVLGAGVIGLATARALARRKLSVEVLTRDLPGAGASAASAGMLEVHFPAPVPPNLAALCNPSRLMYDGLADELLGETGVDIELDRTGTLTLAPGPAELSSLRAQAAAIPGSRLLERNAEWNALEPLAALDFAGALLLPDDHHVNPRKLCEALLLSCERMGIAVRRGITASRLAVSGGRVTGIETGSGRFLAGLTVVAAGAWAGALGGLPLPLPVRPVRGQILVLEPRTRLRHVLHGPSVYAVPRADGTILLGATIEEAGFDVRATAGGVSGLLAEGFRLSPALRDAVLREVRVGLRPGTPDDLPIIGETGLPGLLLAAGLFRKGVLLAPVVAEAVASLASCSPPPVPLGPYSAGRFGGR